MVQTSSTDHPHITCRRVTYLNVLLDTQLNNRKTQSIKLIALLLRGTNAVHPA